MKTKGYLLKDMGLKSFSFRNAKEILKTSWATTAASFRMFLKLIKFFFNPSWEGIHLMQRLLVVPVVEIILGERSGSAIMGEMYAKYYGAKVQEETTGTKATILPDFEKLNLVIGEYKVIKMTTLVIFALLYAATYEFLDEMHFLIMLIVGSWELASLGEILPQSFDFVGNVGEFILLAISYAIYFVMAWLAVVFFRFMFVMLREINRVDEEEIKAYAYDSVQYLVEKSLEIGEPKIALAARDAVIETVAIEKKPLIMSEIYDSSLKELQRGNKIRIRIERKPAEDEDETKKIEKGGENGDS